MLQSDTLFLTECVVRCFLTLHCMYTCQLSGWLTAASSRKLQ